MFKPIVRLGLAAVIALTALPASAVPGKKSPDAIRVTFVNVGSGLCTLIECPEGQGNSGAPILYDCGSSGVGDTGLDREAVVEFVKSILKQYPQGTRLRIVVSHPDSDHYNYTLDIMSASTNVDIEGVWLGARFQDYSNPFKNFLVTRKIKVFDERDLPPGSLDQDKRLACGNEPSTILTVNAGASSNAKSLVLRVEKDKFSATLTGDATVETLASSLANTQGVRVKTTLLSAPHHGAVTDGSNSFIWPKAFQPEIVIYSAGTRFEHPRCQAVDAYDEAGSLSEIAEHPLRCGEEGIYWRDPHANAQFLTATSGSISVTSTGDGKFLVTCDPNLNCQKP